MDRMKKQIEKRLQILWIAYFILLIISIYDNVGPGFPVTGSVNEHILQFQHGLRLGGMLVLLVVIFKYIFALRDEKKLRKLYYNMTDERMAMVRMKSGAPVLLGCSIALFVFSIVAMYLDSAVSLTLIGCAIFLLLVAVISKAYWNSRLTGNLLEETE